MTNIGIKSAVPNVSAGRMQVDAKEEMISAKEI
jgi:hypothetical protein